MEGGPVGVLVHVHAEHPDGHLRGEHPGGGAALVGAVGAGAEAHRVVSVVSVAAGELVPRLGVWLGPTRSS